MYELRDEYHKFLWHKRKTQNNEAIYDFCKKHKNLLQGRFGEFFIIDRTNKIERYKLFSLYLSQYKENIDEIISNIGFLLDLGYKELELDLKRLYEKKENVLDTSDISSHLFVCTDNIEVKKDSDYEMKNEKNVDNKKIYYETNKSDYEMLLSVPKDNSNELKLVTDRPIKLGTLLFDQERFPKSYTYEDLIEPIINRYNEIKSIESGLESNSIKR